MSLFEQAAELMNAAFDASAEGDTAQEAVLLEEAAVVYETADSPEDAEFCRALIEIL